MSVKNFKKQVCIHGDVVQEDGSVLKDQFVLIKQGKIQSSRPF